MNIIDILYTAAQTGIDTLGQGLDFKLQFDISRAVAEQPITISIIGYVVCFAALLTLFIFITNFTKLLAIKQRRRIKQSTGEDVEEKKDFSISGEINAAISMAIHQYYHEIHDYEHTILTIKKLQRPYSPWSSKIYNITPDPRLVKK